MWRMGHKIYKDAIDLTRMAIQTGLLLVARLRAASVLFYRSRTLHAASLPCFCSRLLAVFRFPFSHFRSFHPQIMMTEDEEVSIVAEAEGFVKGLGTKVVRFACQDGRTTLFLSLIYGG